MEDLVHFRH